MELKQTIKDIAKEQGMTLKDVADKAGLNYNGLHDKFRRGSITVRDLNRILDVLEKELSIKDKSY